MKRNHLKSATRESKLNRTLFSLACLVCLAGIITPAFAEPMQSDTPKTTASCTVDAQLVVEQLVATLPEQQRTQLLQVVNQGTEQDLLALPGIAATRSKAIQAARPFTSLADLLRVPGIGKATLVRILKHDSAVAAQAPTGMGS